MCNLSKIDCNSAGSHENPEHSADARQAVARWLTVSDSLLLVTHDRPDGDALGAAVALARAARLRGKTARVVLPEPVPRKYAFLMEGEQTLDAAGFAEAANGADCVVVLDTCSWPQLTSVAATLRAVKQKVVVIDHHRTHEDVGAVAWIDDHAAAAGVMVTELLERLGWSVDMPGARAALTAICSDTGWLRFSNTDSRALAAAGRWLDFGVDPAGLYRLIFENDRPQRIALLSRVLAGLRLFCQDRLAVMTVLRADFAQTGATPDETENMINESMRIATVEVAVMLVETESATRVSLRSKSPDIATGQPPVDVSAVAQLFGGGGHARAAGFRLVEPPAQVGVKLVEAIEPLLGCPPSGGTGQKN